MASNQPVIWKFKFVRSDGLAQEIVVPSGQSFMVGRDPVCECRLDGRKVSRRHCRLRADTEGLIHIEDNGSHNGTFVNGQRIINTTLKGGEIILVGEWQGETERVDMNADPAPVPSRTPQPTEKSTTSLPKYPGDPTLEISPLEDPSAENPFGDPGNPMTGSWRWQENAPIDSENDGIRVVPVDQNPIVQRLSESSARLDFRGLGQLVDPSSERSLTPTGINVDAVALQFVFQVTEALQAASSMDEFLADMSESLRSAARAKAVVVLLPDEEHGELTPRVVQTRRLDESVHLSKTVLQYAVSKQAAVTTEDATADERFADGESVMRFDLKAVLVVPLMRQEEVVGAVYLTRDLPFTDTERDLVAALAHMIAVGLDRSRLRDQIADEERQRRALERFHAPDVVRRLMMEDKAIHEKSSSGDGLFLESLQATVLFCDLSGFTRFCENSPPERVGQTLNRYLGTMTEIVFEHGGTVDKYIGDAIMCVFGAPFMSPDDPHRAVSCAVEMRSAFRRMRLSGELGDGPVELDVHIGVNTGAVVAGTVGSPLRMEYTALGDAVNLAARLEGVAKAGQIVIGPSTADLVRDVFSLETLGEVAIKGKSEPIEVFAVLDEEENTETHLLRPELDGMDDVPSLQDES